MNRYELLKDEIIQCPYCNLYINLYYIRNHNKTKRCKCTQQLLIKTKGKKEFNLLELEHNRNINNLLSELKHNED